MRHFSTFRGLYIAADAAIRRRRARDGEDPTNEELDEERATPDDLVEVVKEWLTDLDPEESERVLDEIIRLRDEYGATAGMDFRAHRGASGARRARGAGDRNRHAGDAALPPGVRPAAERFQNIGRCSTMGTGRDDLVA